MQLMYTRDWILSSHVLPLFSAPLGRSRMTILLLFLGPLGPGFLVRVPLVPQPHIDTGCLSDLDLPRPPP